MLVKLRDLYLFIEQVTWFDQQTNEIQFAGMAQGVQLADDQSAQLLAILDEMERDQMTLKAQIEAVTKQAEQLNKQIEQVNIVAGAQQAKEQELAMAAEELRRRANQKVVIPNFPPKGKRF
jgi:hypothetical protein